MKQFSQGRIVFFAVLGMTAMLSGAAAAQDKPTASQFGALIDSAERWVAAAQGNSTAGPTRWMAPETLSKNDLAEAVAAKSGLSKADAKKALDGFIDASTKIMSEHIDHPLYCWGSSSTRSIIDPVDSDNDGLLDFTWAAFGAFSVVSGGIGASGCPAPNEVVFQAGPAFRAHENPLSKEEMEWHQASSSARAIPPKIMGLEVTAPAIPYGAGQIVVFGNLGERAFSAIDTTLANDAEADRALYSGDEVCVFDDTGIVARATVVGVAVEAQRGRFDVVDSTASGGVFLGLVLEGPSHRDVRRGMLIATCPADRPVRCENPVRGFDDDDLIAGIVRETRLPARTAATALAATYAVIAGVVNDGGIVDLEGFGRFEAETVITATITETRRPPLLAIDVWERSVSLVGASEGEIDTAELLLTAQAKRSARTGRNPQTGKEIKIAAKNGVKFKAGADLSGKVN